MAFEERTLLNVQIKTTHGGYVETGRPDSDLVLIRWMVMWDGGGLVVGTGAELPDMIAPQANLSEGDKPLQSQSFSVHFKHLVPQRERHSTGLVRAHGPHRFLKHVLSCFLKIHIIKW